MYLYTTPNFYVVIVTRGLNCMLVSVPEKNYTYYDNLNNNLYSKTCI